MAIYFRAADRREVPASEALDARGILRHGYGQRVPHTMRDAAPRLTARSFWDQGNLRVTDARAIGGVEGCRPGYRVLDSDVGRQAKLDAYQQYEAELTSAYRNPPRDAAFGSHPYGAYPLSAGEGNQCTINGAPGTLVREGDVLVCKPIRVGADAAKPPRDPEEEDDDDENGDDEDDGEVTADGRIATVDAMSATHQQNMSRIYDQIAIDLSQQWREGK